MNGPMIVDGWVIFADGRGRKLTDAEMDAFAAGQLTTVSSEGARFTPVGHVDITRDDPTGSPT